MDKATFYRGKSRVRTEWRVNDGNDLRFRWARQRVFDDGTADVCWQEGATLHGFADALSAGAFLSEDEYLRFAGLTADDVRELELGLTLSAMEPPRWEDRPDQPFVYLGTY